MSRGGKFWSSSAHNRAITLNKQPRSLHIIAIAKDHSTMIYLNLKCSSHWVLLRHHQAARDQATLHLVVEFVNPNFKGVWKTLVSAARRTKRLLAKDGAVVVHCNSGHHRALEVTAALLCGLKQCSYKEAVAWQDYHDCSILELRLLWLSLCIHWLGLLAMLELEVETVKHHRPQAKFDQPWLACKLDCMSIFNGFNFKSFWVLLMFAVSAEISDSSCMLVFQIQSTDWGKVLQVQYVVVLEAYLVVSVLWDYDSRI